MAAGCGFLNPNNSPDPLWGIWAGPYPTVLSTQPDSSRWAFTSYGTYVFLALKRDSTLLGREVGYYHNEGIWLVLSSDKAGIEDIEEIEYEVEVDRLTMSIRGHTYLFDRAAGADEADRLGEALLR